MNAAVDLGTLQAFATALLIGALIGVEREKRKPEGALLGLRTFTLLALLGALGGWLTRILAQPVLLIAVLVVAALLVLAGYVQAARSRTDALGLTTAVAALVVCLLGATVTLGQRELAVALAVVTAALLAYKQPLHGLVGRLGWDDVFAGLRLLLASFVVLPLLPDHPVDPWQALNPYRLWLLVILISSLSLVGYVATRWLGPERGTALTGASGGLVSSTAVTLAFARRGTEEPEAADALACGVLLSWCVMFARVVVAVLLVNPALVSWVLAPFAAMSLATAALALLFYRRSRRTNGRGVVRDVPLKNPFSLTEAVKFAAFFAAILLLVELVQRYLPGQGIYLVAALAGVTDVDAITLSMAEYARANDPAVAVRAIVLAVLSNTLVKCGLAVGLGGRALRWPVLIGTGAVLAAAAAALLA